MDYPQLEKGSALVSNHQYERAIADCNKSLKLNPRRKLNAI
ncbi:hypothetical protein BH11CYA1_BH11CYA1_20480 [soil metagenome]